MRTVLRAGCVALIALGIAGQTLRASHDYDEGILTTTLIGRLAKLNIQTSWSSNRDMLVGTSPLCKDPVFLVPLQIDGSEDNAGALFRGPDFVTRYVYLGVVESHVARARWLGQWAWEMVLFDTGLRPTRPSRSLTLVALPRACVHLLNMDWSTLSS
jgi:hypothetical protein